MFIFSQTRNKNAGRNKENIVFYFGPDKDQRCSYIFPSMMENYDLHSSR